MILSSFHFWCRPQLTARNLQSKLRTKEGKSTLRYLSYSQRNPTSKMNRILIFTAQMIVSFGKTNSVCCMIDPDVSSTHLRRAFHLMAPAACLIAAMLPPDGLDETRLAFAAFDRPSNQMIRPGCRTCNQVSFHPHYRQQGNCSEAIANLS